MSDPKLPPQAGVPAALVVPIPGEGTVNPFDLPALPPSLEKKSFWIGTLPGCPQYNVGIGSMMFHRYIDPPIGHDNDSGATQRSYQRGQVVELSADQVAGIYANMKDKVVRFHGSRGEGNIHNLSSPHFTREANDQPLAMFVYMLPMDEKALIQRSQMKGEFPISVYEMFGGKEKRQIPTPPPKPAADIAPEIEDLDKPEGLRHTPPQLAGAKKK